MSVRRSQVLVFVGVGDYCSSESRKCSIHVS
jgi:hypothetical protein